MSKHPQLLVIQPDPLGGPDRFAGWLADAGLTIRTVQPFAGQPVPDTLDEAGLLVMGGDMGANDDDEYPWLADIRRLMCESVDLDRPTLGICLGGQLLSRALGGTVTAGNRGLEAGVVRVDWRPEADCDPMFADLPAPFFVGAMHNDMITTLPDGATWLAYNDTYPHQAFRAAPSAWGVQFHPEVSLKNFHTWVSAWKGTGTAERRKLHQGASDFQQLEAEIANSTHVIAKRFADLIAART